MESKQSHLTIFQALLSGLLLGLSVNHFFGVSLAFVLPFCLIGIFSALENQPQWKQWYWHGYVFSFASLFPALIGFIWVDPFSGIVMVAVASFLYAVPFALLYLVRRRLNSDNAWTFLTLALIYPPYSWFVNEKLFGFPITLFANSLANYPVFIQFVDITGYTGISAWVITLNVLVFQLCKTCSKHPLGEILKNTRAKKLIAGILIWISLPLMYAFYAYSVLPDTFQGSAKVAVIQSENVDTVGESDSTAVFPTLKTTLALTDSVISQHKPDLVVWPEGALPTSVRTDPNSLIFITDRVLRWQTPLATGIFDRQKTPSPIPPLQRYLGRDYFLYNAVTMITPQFSWKVLMEDMNANPLRVYRKVNLMPFLEHVPLSARYPSLSKLSLEIGGNQHLQKGESNEGQAFLTQDGRIVHTIPFICWDVLFASTHRAEHLKQAQLITVHSSAQLFGDKINTSIICIQNYTRLRSVEIRKSVAQSSTTGFSFLANPLGEILGEFDPFKNGYSVATVPLRRGITFYSQHPNLFPIICLIIITLITIKPSNTRLGGCEKPMDLSKTKAAEKTKPQHRLSM